MEVKRVGVSERRDRELKNLVSGAELASVLADV